MIYIGGKRIIDILYYKDNVNTRIKKATYSKTIDTIYDPLTSVSGDPYKLSMNYEINTGDSLTFIIHINDKDYDVVDIDNKYSTVNVNSNVLTFTLSGEYNITATYKTYIINLTINVYDIGLTLE